GGILAATLIMVLMLAPLFWLGGVEGLLLRPLAIAYVVAMLASLATAMTLTPVLCLLLAGRAARQQEAPLARWCKRGLDRALPWMLARPQVVGAGALVVVAMAGALAVALPPPLMPPFNEGSLTVELNAVPGITLVDSTRLGAVAETLLLEIPEVAAVGRRTGRAELDEHAQGIETTEIDVRLKPSDRPRQ